MTATQFVRTDKYKQRATLLWYIGAMSRMILKIVLPMLSAVACAAAIVTTTEVAIAALDGEHITIDKEVVGLTYDTQFQRSGQAGWHLATVTCTVVIPSWPENLVFLGYEWLPDVGIGGQADLIRFVDTSVETNFNNNSATGYIFSTGEGFHAICKVHYRNVGWPVGTESHFLVTTREEDKVKFSIGGTLLTSTVPGSTTARPRSAIGATPDVNGDHASPVFAQAFGWAASTLFLDNNSQVPQSVKVQPRLTQPTGVQIDWTVNGSAHVDADSGLAGLKFSVLSGTALGAIKPQAEFSILGSAFEDCSDEYKIPTTHLVTGHQPASVDFHEVAEEGHSLNAPGIYGWRYCELLMLTDHLGMAMPGVWIQERFFSTPPDFEGNPTGNFWTTSASTGGGGQLEGYSHGVFGPDNFQIKRPYPYLYGHPNGPYWSLTQQYVASSKSSQWGHMSGIVVDVFTINYWTNWIDHVKN